MEMARTGESVQALRAHMARLREEVQSKAVEEVVVSRMEKIVTALKEHTAMLPRKTNWAAVHGEHRRHVSASSAKVSTLRADTERLGERVIALEESIKQVAGKAGGKAEDADARECLRVSDASRAQLREFKRQVGGTIQAIETYILDLDAKTPAGMKLQPKPADGVGRQQESKPADGFGSQGLYRLARASPRGFIRGVVWM